VKAATKPELPYMPEARALYNLISDGHRGLRYHVSRGCALRDRATRKPIIPSYVERGTWRPAREVDVNGNETDRLLNAYVVRKHLLGEYDVAFEWPSWTSLVVFDVDRHLPGGLSAAETHPEIVRVANQQRDEVLEQLAEAFGFADRPPVVLQTPNEGYHVYLPLCRGANGEEERTWPAAWLREQLEHKLNRHGISLHPGRLELFPAGTRLRLPCGRGMLLLDPLDLEPVAGTADQNRYTRRIGPMTGAFCEAIEASRRPLDEWLGSAPCWDRVWGPWGRKSRNENEGLGKGDLWTSRHKEDVLTPSAPEGGHLLYGAEFIARVQELARCGLTEEGQRHDAALKLTWYWGVCLALSEAECLGRLSEWLESFDHCSHLLPGHPRKFYRDTMREAAHYYAAHVLPRRSSGTRSERVDVAPRALAPPDEDLVSRTPLGVREEARALLRYLATQAGGDGRVPHPVTLGGGLLESMCGSRRLVVEQDGVRVRRRAYVVAVEALVDLGVLALHTDYSTGRHGRRYTCWYQFGTGRVPRADGDRRVLAERDIEEGRLQVVSDAPRPPTVRLVSRPGDSPCPAVEPLTEPLTAAEPPAAPEPSKSAAVTASPDPAGSPQALISASRPDPSRALPWWVRMYGRRAFTPCEFFEADARRVIPGPFRHRFGDPRRLVPTLHPGPASDPHESDPAAPIPVSLHSEPVVSTASEPLSPSEPEPSVPELPAEFKSLSLGSLEGVIAQAWASWRRHPCGRGDPQARNVGTHIRVSEGTHKSVSEGPHKPTNVEVPIRGNEGPHKPTDV
jgi:hypothetical protein